MKTYETWEVIKMLAENTTLKFVVVEADPEDDSELTLSVNDLGNLTFESKWKRDQYFGSLLKHKWKILKEPVDFITAINDGKRIKSEHWNKGFVDVSEIFKELNGFVFEAAKIFINGKWFIEE